MTSTEAIRTALTALWDTGANAYELAQAVMKAADIESADIELEVESVIARALLAREFVGLSKVAAEVAKVLPGGLRLELEIGKTYLNREGDKVRIVSRQAHSRLPFRGSDTCAYREDGGFRSDGDESGFDLIEECEPDATEQPKPEALPLCEVIVAEINEEFQKLNTGPFGDGASWGLGLALSIIRQHFAALSVEELAKVIDPFGFAAVENSSEASEPKRAVSRATKKAQAVLRLLRRE